MRNKVSLALLLGLMTIAAVIASLYRVAGTNPFAGSALLVVESIIATFALYGLFFCLAYPLGRLDKYLMNRHRIEDSPFAGDRLPTQIIPPIDRAGE